MWRTAPAHGRDRPRARRDGNSLPARPGIRSSWPRSWPFRYARCRSKSTGRFANRARPLQVFRGIDAERHALHDGCVDAHARFERAQLFELLAPFERRGRKRDEAPERGTAKGIKPDVMVERALAGRRRRTREIERAQP